MNSLLNSAQEECENYKTPFIKEDELFWNHVPIVERTRHTQYYWAVEIHWLTRLFIAQVMRLKDEDCAIILIEIAEVKEEIGEVKESLHKLRRKFGVCLFPIPEVASVHPFSSVTPPNNVLATPKGTTLLQGCNGLPGFEF